MQPIPVPKEIFTKWNALGWRKVKIDPPPDTDIYPVESLVGTAEYGAEFNILIQITEEDRKILEMNDWRFWYTVHTGQLTPFRFTLLGEDGSNESLTNEEILALQAPEEEPNGESLPT